MKTGPQVEQDWNLNHFQWCYLCEITGHWNVKTVICIKERILYLPISKPNFQNQLTTLYRNVQELHVEQPNLQDPNGVVCVRSQVTEAWNLLSITMSATAFSRVFPRKIMPHAHTTDCWSWVESWGWPSWLLFLMFFPAENSAELMMHNGSNHPSLSVSKFI